MTDWNHPGFGLPVLAEGIGPFASADFLSTLDPYEGGDVLLASSDGCFMALRRLDDEIHFAGDPELTDYHSPRGHGVERLVAKVAADHSPGRMVLDSLPDEAAQPLAMGLRQADWDVTVEPHEVVAVLDLPAGFDEYLEGIGKKERHEVRRKRRRYERMVGDVAHETHRGPGWAWEEFVRLHRLAKGNKGRFLTSQREELFADLARLDGWRFDLLHTEHDTAAAVVFGYSDDDAYYLYNAAYDPAFADASPGVVLLGTMIERAIGEGLARFDFLKGDEDYKFRLGARRRPLQKIVATPGRPE